MPLKVKRKNRRVQFKTSSHSDLAVSSSSSSGYASSEGRKQRQRRKRQEKTAQWKEFGDQPSPLASSRLDIKSVASIPECVSGRQASNVTSEVRLSPYDKGRGGPGLENRTFSLKEPGETSPLSETKYESYGTIPINVSTKQLLQQAHIRITYERAIG